MSEGMVSYRIRMTEAQSMRLGLMAEMMGMTKASFIKMLINDKFIRYAENGMIDAYKRMTANVEGR